MLKKIVNLSLPATLLITLLASSVNIQAEPFANGFDLEGSLIPIKEILSGGPPKDGIPALDDPKFINADDADYLADTDRVIGFEHNGEARAYPIRILNYHELVNDSVGGKDISVSYCPLCGSGIVFDALVDGKKNSFGVSGLLYNSDLLMYDRNTDSLWSQIEAKAVTGKLVGTRLTPLAAPHTSWADWKQKHPKTLVMSLETGHNRNYSRSPYGDYDVNQAIYFPVKNTSKRYHPKERVLAVEIDDQFKAYPFSELAKLSGEIDDEFAGSKLRIGYDKTAERAYVLNADGSERPALTTFWFAWYGFHPETELWEAK